MARMQVAAPKNKTIPDGETVTFRVYEFEQKEGKKGPYINWTMLVAMEGSPYHDMKVWHITSFSPTATFGLVRLLDGCGLQIAEEGAELSPGYYAKVVNEAGEEMIEFDTDDVVGKTFEATVKNEEYQGKSSTKIDKILVPEAP